LPDVDVLRSERLFAERGAGSLIVVLGSEDLSLTDVGQQECGSITNEKRFHENESAEIYE
jgi:hypothetical protein